MIIDKFKSEILGYRFMEVKCIKCKKSFKGDYEETNEINKRVWCDDCVIKEWNKRKLNNTGGL